eukprot:g6798.t1
MAAFNTKNPFEKLHSDVLYVEPTTEEEKEKLIAEIKERGNNAFKTRRMEEADMLYSRAIELDNTIYALYGNRSAVNHTMGKYEKALEDAISAIKNKPDWAKGYFRKGNALYGLKRPHAAVEAFEQSLKLEGKTNKAVEKAMNKAKKLGEQISREDEELANNVNEQSTKASSPTTTRSSNATKEVLQTQRKAEKMTGKDVVKSNDIGEVSKTDVVRGYKKTKDGRTTTFFHRDIDDAAKKLIGNIAPKKIDPVTLNNDGQTDGSAWNKGGTYEEKNISDWAKDRLMDLLANVSTTCNDAVVKVKNIVKLEGEAQVFVLRGTKRFMFEFNVEMEWSAMCNKEGSQDFEGTIVYPDLSTDACGDYEVNVNITGTSSSSIPDALRSNIVKTDGIFQTEIRRVVRQFETEFVDSSFKK